MKHTILLALLATSLNANATWPGATALTQSQQQQSNSYSNGGNASGGDNDTRFIAFSTTSANAQNGNAGINCPVITVVSEGKQYAFGLYSNSNVGKEPAQINAICPFFHKAMQSGKKEDWDNFFGYLRSVNTSVDNFLKRKQGVSVND